MTPSGQGLNQGMQKIKVIASKIIRDEIDPHLGCDQIASVCEALDFPSQLDEFFHLSHLQKDHDHLGFQKEDIKADIIDEAKKFLSSYREEEGAT